MLQYRVFLCRTKRVSQYFLLNRQEERFERLERDLRDQFLSLRRVQGVAVGLLANQSQPLRVPVAVIAAIMSSVA